jgi:hypothetical protein
LDIKLILNKDDVSKALNKLAGNGTKEQNLIDTLAIL